MLSAWVCPCLALVLKNRLEVVAVLGREVKWFQGTSLMHAKMDMIKLEYVNVKGGRKNRDIKGKHST